jgi:uncharacterized protein (DUF305 family)
MYSFEAAVDMARHRMAVLVLLSLVSGACATARAPAGPQVVQPGAPGQPGRIVSPAPPAAPKYAEADVKFMQGMIGHHAQALEMTALLPSRTATDAMKLLAEAKGVAFDRLFLELMIKHDEGAGRRRHRRAASAAPRSINWTSWRGNSRPTPPRRRTASRHG